MNDDRRDSDPGDDGGHSGDNAPAASGDDERPPDDDKRPPDDGDEELRRLLAEFDALAETVDSPEEHERVRAARNAAVVAAQDDELFGQVITGYDRADLAEAFVGSLLFGIPMFVEGGTNEVGAFLASHPVSLVGTLVGAVGLVVGILYVADIQDMWVYKPILGVVPRRLVGVLGASVVTALVVMTAWGRVEWSDPVLALATVVAAFVPMSVGAALGDILPGS
ncbi:hypothetical protein GCM10008995_07120 [Halobellus salinus]|uniref:DUF2391 family protein n=1 Tax=Halobellus salinus TaxID=931585 RepID=A0A830ECZ0_9EURY|nr:DUF2391 domain-containing protein [Halobellus salinus]GGI99831.1 hypothetical protein GCM10008995_07120 [Halobellus salinus]SMP02437.1 Putative integral membrane protein [Halobellus salinus]